MVSKKIGVDCRMIKESGIGRYTQNLILNLNEIDNVNEYFLFVMDQKDITFHLNSNFKIIPAPIVWHGIEEQTKFLKIINSFNLDIFHSPHPNMPYFYSRDFVITIHDLTMLNERTGRASTYLFPIYYLKWLVFKFMLHFAVKKAKKIITVSDFVKNQIIEEFKISEEKIEVIYNGVSDSIYRVQDTDLIEKIKQKYKITKPFLFYIGNAYPHKNLERLILAFKLFNFEGKYQLVLGGKEDFFYKRLKNEYSKLDDLLFAGYLSDEEISSLYTSCELFVYPSISEGFGIQIIEALKIGSKVVCSNNTSFPEIASEFAYYFNPYDIGDIKNTLEKAIRSKPEYSVMEIKKHLMKFDWLKSAQKHHEIYQKN